MLSFALIPLSLYFFFLAFLSLRERPTVLSGIQDWMLLCGSVAGLLAFGPGKLLIPVRLYVFWGISIWVFWLLFYILIAYIIAKHFLPKRTVIYGCPPEIFTAVIKEPVKKFAPESSLEGNVIHIPGSQLQCCITGNARGGFTVLTSTNSEQDDSLWTAFEDIIKKELTSRFTAADFLSPNEVKSTLTKISMRCFFFRFFCGSSIALVSFAMLVYNAKELRNCFFDYWV
ncbi:hypothetical protein FACS189427_02100 [Planctomycetales bacterium]|nr:hypothetical protein FACS189427_02100 [Planctomycetales bacterium]